MERVIEVDGKQVGLKATALTPRLYRHLLGRDMIVDMSRLKAAFAKADHANKLQEPAEDASQEEWDAYIEKKNEGRLTAMDLTIFENAAYVMARQYATGKGEEFPSSPEEWLDGFDMFSIYDICPTIMELWAINNQTTAIPKKK